MFDPLEVKVLFPTRWRKAERKGVAGKTRDLRKDRRQKTPIWFGLAEVSRGEAARGVRDGDRIATWRRAASNPRFVTSSSNRRTAGCGPACPAVWQGER